MLSLETKIALLREMETMIDPEDQPDGEPGVLGHYADLVDILLEAYQQAAHGKGKERHANARAFSDQPILSIGTMVGMGYPLGQAMKKLQESRTLLKLDGGQHRAFAEILGAMVYAAAAAMLVRDGKA